MLFKALLTRLCGGTNISQERAVESRRRFARSTYNRYPKLAETVTRLLRLGSTQVERAGSENTTRKIEMVFPALEIVDKVGVAVTHSTTVTQMLFDLLCSKAWRLREKAAQSLSLLLEPRDVLQRLLPPTEKAEPFSTNALHGILMCLKLTCDQCNFEEEGIRPTKEFFGSC